MKLLNLALLLPDRDQVTPGFFLLLRHGFGEVLGTQHGRLPCGALLCWAHYRSRFENGPANAKTPLLDLRSIVSRRYCHCVGHGPLLLLLGAGPQGFLLTRCDGSGTDQARAALVLER